MDTAAAITEGSTIVINRINYVVEVCRTVEMIDNEGNDFYAEHLRGAGFMAEMAVRRPRGAKIHIVRAYPRDAGGYTLRYIQALV